MLYISKFYRKHFFMLAKLYTTNKISILCHVIIIVINFYLLKAHTKRKEKRKIDHMAFFFKDANMLNNFALLLL